MQIAYISSNLIKTETKSLLGYRIRVWKWRVGVRRSKAEGLARKILKIKIMYFTYHVVCLLFGDNPWTAVEHSNLLILF